MRKKIVEVYKRDLEPDQCRFCSENFASCTCNENAVGDYYNEAKKREDPFG